jgi:hypothetical protein
MESIPIRVHRVLPGEVIWEHVWDRDRHGQLLLTSHAPLPTKEPTFIAHGRVFDLRGPHPEPQPRKDTQQSTVLLPTDVALYTLHPQSTSTAQLRAGEFESDYEGSDVESGNESGCEQGGAHRTSSWRRDIGGRGHRRVVLHPGGGSIVSMYLNILTLLLLVVRLQSK